MTPPNGELFSDSRRVLVCNAALSTSAYSIGSLAYVLKLGGGGKRMVRVLVRIRSRSGRWIDVWIAVSKLANFRFKSILNGKQFSERLYGDFTEEDLEALSADGAGQSLTLRGRE